MIEREPISKPSVAERMRDFASLLVDSDHNPMKRLSLLKPGQTLNDINQTRLLLELGFDSWWRETHIRDGRRWSIVQYGIEDIRDFVRSGFELTAYMLEGLIFAGRVALNDRIGNEFTQLDIQRGKSGQLFNDARENFLIGDHSRFHERRIERIMEMLMMNVWFLRHGEENISEWLLPAYIYTGHHDKDQAITQQRNFLAGTRLKPKTMHAEAAAVRIGVMPDLLAKASDLPQETVEKQLVAAMVMILVHPESEIMNQRLNTAGQAADFRHEPKKLYQEWLAGNVNVFSLTRQDLAVILREGKSKDGFVSEATPFGLDPDFESVQGNRKRLKNFAADGDKTFGEILGFSASAGERAHDKRYRSFKHTVDVCVLADLIDMYSPALESIFRKILVPYSRVRPWFRMKGWGNPKNLETILSGKGNIDTEEDCDLRRSLWEIVNTFSVFKDSRVGQSTFVSQVLLPEIAREGLIGFKQASRSIMSGSFEIGRQVFFQREIELTFKILRRGKVKPALARAIVKENLLEDQTLNRNGVAAAIAQHCPHLLEDYQVIARLDQEKEEARLALAEKPEICGKRKPLRSKKDGLVIYSNDHIQHACRLIDRAARMINLDISGGDQGNHNSRIRSFKAYTPLGSRTTPKVLHQGVVD